MKDNCKAWISHCWADCSLKLSQIRQITSWMKMVNIIMFNCLECGFLQTLKVAACSMHYLDKRYPVHGSSEICLWIFNRLSTPVFYNVLWKTKQGNLRTILSVQYQRRERFQSSSETFGQGPSSGWRHWAPQKGKTAAAVVEGPPVLDASKWEAHWTMFSNKLQDVFPFALIELGIVTNKSPDRSLKQAFLENVHFGIPIVPRNVIQYFLLKSCCDYKSRMF